MAPSAVQNIVASVEAKLGGGKKNKKAGKAERTESPAPAATSPPAAPASVTAADEDDESPYVREIRKNIRNVNKKLTNASKTDSLIASHPDKSLDDLVAAKIINADQKAQVLKKPGLEAQLAQLQEQLTQYQKIDGDYRARIASEKAAVEKSLTDKYENEHKAALTAAQEKAEKDAAKKQTDDFLVLSQFLRLAAARRAEEADSTLDENMALEGVLLSVYGGDEKAVASMQKLVQGADEPTRSTLGETLKTTYAQVKAVSVAYSTPLFQPFQTEETTTETKEEEDHPPVSDPTITHAGLTEIDEGSTQPMSNGQIEAEKPSTITAADVADSGANAAGENQWDNTNTSNDLTESQEWVNVNPAETQSEAAATPAAAAAAAAAAATAAAPATPAAPTEAAAPSWADDHPDPAATAAVAASTDANDGFQSVQRKPQGQNHRGRGGFRGDGRGRGGFRGDGRGRGRGGQRGGPRRGGAQAGGES